MTSWDYIIQSFPWALAGILVGWFMGRSTVAVESIAEAVKGDTVDTTVKRRRRPTSMAVLGVVVVVLGVFTAVQGYVQGAATARLAECQQAYSNGFADALDARSKATVEAQDALDEFLTTVAHITPAPEAQAKFQAAFSEYLDKRAAAKKAQKEHPFPPAPRDVCKETG